jgi:hypothetical protein
MRPAGLAHTVIVVQSTTKKDAKPRFSAIGAQAHLDHLLRAAHQRRARTGPVRGRQARRQKGSPDHPTLPAAQMLAGMSHGRVEAPGRGLHAWG